MISTHVLGHREQQCCIGADKRRCQNTLNGISDSMGPLKPQRRLQDAP